MAEQIAINAPLALRYMKEGLRRGVHGDAREVGGWAIETIRKLMRTDDHREGVAAFLERREPVFQGK
jgi:enoyl-CoA hydratase/carnithine racemase